MRFSAYNCADTFGRPAGKKIVHIVRFLSGASLDRELTPKQIARAIQVSESSVKRWCDQGLMEASRTGGKHRRIPLRSVLKFLKETHRPILRPELLGLPATTGQGPGVLSRASERFQKGLLAGDEECCRQILFDLHLADHPVSQIGDEVISPAFQQIGHMWSCADIEVYEERRGCETCGKVLNDLAGLLPTPSSDAPLALGGAPGGDIYRLPTTIIELVLRERGWRSMSLGSNLPWATLEAAIRENKPRLFWLTVSHIPEEASFVSACNRWLANCKGLTSIAMGGRALIEPIRRRLDLPTWCDRLETLDAFAATLYSRPASPAEE